MLTIPYPLYKILQPVYTTPYPEYTAPYPEYTVPYPLCTMLNPEYKILHPVYTILHPMNIISYLCTQSYTLGTPQWRAADVEVQLKCSPFTALNRSVYSHTCYVYCQEFVPYFYPSGPFTCIFSKTSPNFFLRWLWLTPVPV